MRFGTARASSGPLKRPCGEDDRSHSAFLTRIIQFGMTSRGLASLPVGFRVFRPMASRHLCRPPKCITPADPISGRVMRRCPDGIEGIPRNQSIRLSSSAAEYATRPPEAASNPASGVSVPRTLGGGTAGRGRQVTLRSPIICEARNKTALPALHGS